MFVVGTAGHVDHGKSALVHALTGIDPDRLREERERRMTTDLGFAWLTLPSGREVSIVDVPGHEDFIKNMLAGIGGIDLALFVIAADESVMPQTREHLAILDLLQIPHGLVALTKIDLVDDPEWLGLVEEEVSQELQGTVLEDAPILPVSAHTGVGLAALLAEMDRLLAQARPRPDLGRPRLPIDRVFTILGFGTVVTGTLLDGRLAVGDEVEIQPGNLSARIRGLQTHKVKVDEALPGSRVAINLTGVSTDVLWRGQVVTRHAWLRPTTLLDARLKLLSTAPRPLKHNARVDFYTGAARVASHVRLLDAEALEPGQECWVQFRLSEPVAVVRGDRYIVRSTSPSLTLGGGRIVEAYPGRRHKRFRPEVLDRLEALSHGRPEDVLLQLLRRSMVLEARELIRRSGLLAESAAAALSGMVEDGGVVALAEGAPDQRALARSTVGLVSRDRWEALMDRFVRELAAYHRRWPLRSGMPREELKSRARADGQFFGPLVEHASRQGRLTATPRVVRLPEHGVALSPEEQRRVDRALADFRAHPYTPPSYAQVEEALGAELLQFLLESGRLVRASDTVLFDAERYAEMERRVVAHLREQGSITVAQVRDLFDTSRKYALGLLEHLDRRRITKRLGDIRVLR